MPTWLITGTSRGIGLELVRQLAANSANTTIIATARAPASATALTALAAAHKSVHVVPLDVLDDGSVNAAAAAAKTALGGAPLDYLINNAGIGSGDTVDEATPEELERQFRTHVIGPLRVLRAFLPLLDVPAGRRVVVNVSSGLGSIGLDIGPKNASYSVAKAGQNMLTYKISRQYPQLTALVLDPGWVKTDMGGPGAMLDVDFAVGKHIELFESAQHDTHSGRFFRYTGEEIPW